MIWYYRGKQSRVSSGKGAYVWPPLQSVLSRLRKQLHKTAPDSVARKTHANLLALVADEAARKLLAELSLRNQWRVQFAESLEEAVTLLPQMDVPIILCDRDLEGIEWRDVVHHMSASTNGACIILMSRVVDDYLWNEVIGQGGYDVLAKPLREAEVTRAVNLAWTYSNSSPKLATSQS